MICIFRLAIVASRKAQAHYRRQKQRNQLFHALFPLISFEYMKNGTGCSPVPFCLVQLLLLVVVPVAGNGILGLVDHILHHVGLGIGIAAIPILLTAEGQDQLENEGQQQKADTEADALIEGLAQSMFILMTK